MSEPLLLDGRQWSRVVPLLPNDMHGLPPVDDRSFTRGIVYVLRSGCRWKDIPGSYDPHTPARSVSDQLGGSITRD